MGTHGMNIRTHIRNSITKLSASFAEFLWLARRLASPPQLSRVFLERSELVARHELDGGGQFSHERLYEIGKMIRAARLREGYSRQRLATDFGIDKDRILFLETGFGLREDLMEEQLRRVRFLFREGKERQAFDQLISPYLVSLPGTTKLPASWTARPASSKGLPPPPRSWGGQSPQSNRTENDGQSSHSGHPTWFTWFSNLSVGNQVAAVTVVALAFLLLVILPLWMISSILTWEFGGTNDIALSTEPEIVISTKVARMESPVPVLIAPTQTAIRSTPAPTRVVRTSPTKTAPTEPANQITEPTMVPPALTPMVANAPAPPVPTRKEDGRLGSGGLPELQGVGVTDARASSGQSYWRLVEMRFEDAGQEAGNDHTIYIILIDSNGNRVENKGVQVSWEEAGATRIQQLDALSDQQSKEDYCSCNYKWLMYGNSYSIRVDDELPSDQPYGMIMPMHRHVNYRLTFQLIVAP